MTGAVMTFARKPGQTLQDQLRLAAACTSTIKLGLTAAEARALAADLDRLAAREAAMADAQAVEARIVAARDDALRQLRAARITLVWAMAFLTLAWVALVLGILA